MKISALKIALDFSNRMKLVKEHGELSDKLIFLQKRFDIDKISDKAHANEVMAEIKDVQDRLKKILGELSF